MLLQAGEEPFETFINEDFQRLSDKEKEVVRAIEKEMEAQLKKVEDSEKAENLSYEELEAVRSEVMRPYLVRILEIYQKHYQ